MMNKIILAYYINVGHMDSSDVKHVVKLFKEQVSDSSMIQYFIPIKDGETRIECVYPRYVIGEQVDEEFRNTIDKLNEHIKKLPNEQ